MKFQLETLTPEFIDEAFPLLVDHYNEIAHYKDIELAPDVEMYLKAQEHNKIRVYTVRDDEGKLKGYNIFFLGINMHYKKSLQAKQDIVFLDKAFRGQGIGLKFFVWCDEQLKAEGVDVVYHHLKAAHNFGPMLEKIGYELQDLIYSKRLQR